ncbi:MAG: hypothetical protein ABSA46_04055 [Thermodesulfovibrionales bacterium]
MSRLVRGYLGRWAIEETLRYVRQRGRCMAAASMNWGWLME